MIDRYSRQILFPAIGEEGQAKLEQSSVVIIGCGALGTVIATALVRAGIGKIRIVDRDFIEYHNLQRQVIFDEEDIREGLPKAAAAERYLRKVNSSIDIEGLVSDVNYTNIERLVESADVILDGLDNMETRLLINDVSLKYNIPWIYGGAISSYGMTMNIIPGETACFRCFYNNPPRDGIAMTCDTAGVIGTVPFIIGSLQATEAIKILIDSDEISRELWTVDVWKTDFHKFKLGRHHDCPTCNGEYEFLDAKYGVRTTSLCGQNSVQVLNPNIESVSFEKLAKSLESLGPLDYNEFMFRFNINGHEMIVFPDGRVIVKNTDDEAFARGLYAKYIGM
jgi:adenylyltransferase/sulfurtransferase